MRHAHKSELMVLKHPRQHWFAAIGVFMLGIAVGVAAAIASLRRTLPPVEPVIMGNEDEKPEPVPAEPSETPTEVRSR
jgi:hypothetical protein